MHEPPMGKVILRDQKGEYFCGTPADPMFSRNPADATVFDYHRDNVPAEVERFWREEHRVFSPIRVDPPDPFEVCDRCGCRITPLKAVYTGSSFLCPKCAIISR